MPARNNGARIIPTNELWPGAYFDWSGGKSPKGFANGEGIATWYNSSGTKVEEFRGTYANGIKNGPHTTIGYTGGKKRYQQTGTYTNGHATGPCEIFYHIPEGTDRVVHEKFSYDNYGQIHGNVVRRYEDGSRQESAWNHGSSYYRQDYNADGSKKEMPRPSSSSSSSSDTDIIGAMFGLGGIAAGDANLVMGGLSMMAGDGAGAMQHIANVGSGNGSSSATGTAAAGSTSAATPPVKKKVPHRDNLITKYGLRRFEGKGGQMDHYIRQADAAFARWQQTGEEQYYTEHKEVSDIAQQFDKQTRTEGTRMIR